MSKTFDQGKDEIAKLSRYFATNRQAFLAPGVKEAHVRQSLIDPLFEALGWDVRNAAMIAPQYREVVPEDSLDVEGQQKAPDYTFRVGSQPKFFAEAKKCGVNINADPGPAYQLRRYGWSAKVILSVLTDFDELGVYDCSPRPRIGDKASNSRLQYFRSEEYPDRWRELWDVFSREAVWSGLFDQYAASKRKRGSSEVDAEFLKEIEGWRDALARNIALRNTNLSLDDLNTAVQLTIDRIVFLRMAEDRGIEPYEQLLKLCERSDIYSRFMRDLCRKADEKYNSGLFHFQKETGIPETPDRITPNLDVDDKVIKPILQSLYFEFGSPYHFGVLPVEILGTVYERFLGKVIRLTEGHQAKIEEKPEVRKAGGVYYTPSYIVDYIVKNTVGKQIKGKSPAQLAGRKSAPPFRVLDMACGSGSFLLGAYRCLLDHCLSWYLDNKPEAHKKAIYKDPRCGQWRLTIEEKKRILTVHIFGVDIDPQAVEVSKLSLLLKVLEGETDQSFGEQMKIFQERALPNLADNIKCGNSLIGPDYFTDKLIPDLEELKRVNPFDWEQAFPEAMKVGGFDCVVGNPPYMRIQTMKEWAPLEVETYKELYKAAGTGNYDIYVVFIEKSLGLLNKRGKSGLILPHKFFQAQFARPIRLLLSNNKSLFEIIHFGAAQVFQDATNYTCILFISKKQNPDFRFVTVNSLANHDRLFASIHGGQPHPDYKEAKLLQPLPSEEEWHFAAGEEESILRKIKSHHKMLGDITRKIFVGLQTSADKIYVLKLLRVKKNKLLCYSDSLKRKVEIESGIVKPFLLGKDVHRYEPLEAKNAVIFPYIFDRGKAILMLPDVIKMNFPLGWRYLLENREALANREKGKMKGDCFYAYIYPKNLIEFEATKIMTPDICSGPQLTIDEPGSLYHTTTIYSFVFNREVKESQKYFLGVLNSKLLWFFLRSTGTPLRGGYVRFKTEYLKPFPICTIDFGNKADTERHDLMVRLVESMLTMHKQLAEAKSAAQKEVIQRQIDAADAEIDRLVYELYDLTKDEIKIVEGGTK